MESRNAYGWGIVGSNKKGFEWLLIWGDQPHQRIRSGEVFKSEPAALKAAYKFARASTFAPYRKAIIKAVKAQPAHFEY